MILFTVGELLIRFQKVISGRMRSERGGVSESEQLYSVVERPESFYPISDSGLSVVESKNKKHTKRNDKKRKKSG